MKIRFIVLIVFLVLSFIAINPQFDTDGAAIRQVIKGSPAALAGIEGATGNIAPTSREVIQSVNGNQITTVQEYYEQIDSLYPNQTFTLQTDKAAYRLVVPDINGTKGDIGITVYDVPRTNIRKGLDLSGGTRVILKPETPIVQEDLNLVMDNIKQRLNVFGLSDIVVRNSKDLTGDDFIVVEIAGANKGEVRELLGSQGLFQARVANNTVFTGGDDITFVCRSPDCSGIDQRRGGCGAASGGGYVCPFSFSISLSDAAAHRQALATESLLVLTDQGGAYLSEPLELYLDDSLVDSLNIAADLKGRAVNDIQISGSGTGTTLAAAQEDALANMKNLQTVLITGSLPVKLEIVKMDSISPVLGAEFVRNAFLMAIAAILSVALVIFIRYRKFSISVPVIVTMLSEAFIIFGFAALVGWNIDLAAIAGILIAIGTGVDDQIVIVDEAMRKEEKRRSWKDQMQRAFFIIFASYATVVVAMLPLWFAGAGLLRGFAITTIAGVTIGVLITRPAFAAFIEKYLSEDEK